MKLDNIIECPRCKNKKAHAYKRIDVTIWDDEFHKMLNDEYPENNKLNCDTITYKCKCDYCDNYFVAKLKLKCEIDDIIIVNNENDLYKNYFKKENK